jgi:hypothetical protein
MTWHSRDYLSRQSHAAMTGCYTESARKCSPEILTSEVFSSPTSQRVATLYPSIRLPPTKPKLHWLTAIRSLADRRVSWTFSSLLTPLAFFASSDVNFKPNHSK